MPVRKASTLFVFLEHNQSKTKLKMDGFVLYLYLFVNIRFSS